MITKIRLLLTLVLVKFDRSGRVSRWTATPAPSARPTASNPNGGDRRDAPARRGDDSGGNKRIALLISDLRGGGAERSTLGIARGLIALGYAVDLVLFDDANHYPNETPLEARIFVLRSSRERRFRSWVRRAPGFGMRQGLQTCVWLVGLIRTVRSIAAYIDRERPDFLFPALGPAKVSAILASFLVSSRPILIPVMRNVVMNRPLLFRVLYRLLFPFADRIVAVSDGVGDSLVRKLGVPRGKIETIYNPVARPEIGNLAAEAPDHPWMVEAESPVFLAVGRLAPAKDFATLLRAFQRVCRERPARLIILGEGPERRRLETIARRLDVADRVSMPGWVANPFAFMNRASVFVISSRYEGLSLVLIEALACGCPAVSTDCPSGPSEILLDGEIGPLVPVGDDATLAAAMERLLDDPPDKETLRARARFFSVEACAARYDRLIRECTGRSPADEAPAPSRANP